MTFYPKFSAKYPKLRKRHFKKKLEFSSSRRVIFFKFFQKCQNFDESRIRNFETTICGFFAEALDCLIKDQPLSNDFVILVSKSFFRRTRLIKKSVSQVRNSLQIYCSSSLQLVAISNDIIKVNPSIVAVDANFPFPWQRVSGKISSTITQNIVPAANARAYGKIGSNAVTAKHPITPKMGSTNPLICPRMKAFQVAKPKPRSGKLTANPSGKLWNATPIANVLAFRKNA